MNVPVSFKFVVGLRALLLNMYSDMSITNGYFDVVGEYLSGLNTIVANGEDLKLFSKV
jgi:hypothetical protein